MAIKWLSFILLLSAFAAEAQTINAASCSAADVQAAFNSVTSSTTTVNIPAGTCNWSTQVTLTVPSGSTTLSILGAGSLTTTGGGDVTVIVDNYANTNPLLQITTATASSYFRLAGLTLQGGNGQVKQNGLLGILGNSQSTRLDHMHYQLSTYSPAVASIGVRVSGWVYGVMDHDIIDGGTAAFTEGINLFTDQYAGYANGDGAWAAPSALGTGNFFFVEDNTFNQGGAVDDCFGGGRLVFRYNTINNSATQTHPTGGAGDRRGCRAMELYENTLNNPNSSPIFDVFFLSSGTGVIWGNSAPTGYETFVSIYSIRSNNSDYSQTNCSGDNCSAGWGYCGTAFSGTGSTWDQNTKANTSTGYACIDEPGQGQGDQLNGTFPNKCDETTGCTTNDGTWPHEALEPIYEWMDKWAPVPGYGYSFFNNNESTVLNQNRDFYPFCSASNPSYYNCTSAFNGTVGTGSGLLSARPSACTTGVAYWATDTTTLYQCSSTNTWTAYYTPYTYPHPLTASSGTVVPPTGLQAVVN